MTVAYVCIGDEILRGNVVESNGHKLASKLAALHVDLVEARHVGDDVSDIAQALRDATKRAQLVIVTGGLGPTDDDRTRDAVAHWTGSELVRDQQAVKRLRRRAQDRGRTLSEYELRQADRPENAQALANDAGSAPGFYVMADRRVVACFPGVPREFDAMLSGHLDSLLNLAGIAPADRREHLFRLAGVAESEVQVTMAQLPQYNADHVRSLPRFPELWLYSAHGEQDSPWNAALRARWGHELVCEGDERALAALIGEALLRRGMTLTVAESCTGGLIGHQMTEQAGASQWFYGTICCYHNGLKKSLLGVPEETLLREGAVSEQVVAAMADGARRRGGSTFGLATSGIAGPSGGTEDKPVGTLCVGLSSAHGTTTWTMRLLRLDRERFKLRAAHTAMMSLWRALRQL